jgi:hypothetical protein
MPDECLSQPGTPIGVGPRLCTRTRIHLLGTWVNKARCVRPSTAYLLAHRQDGAVGVADHRVRYAAHQGPPYTAQASVAHRYQVGAQLFG